MIDAEIVPRSGYLRGDRQYTAEGRECGGV